jgi:hypothetical protein
MTTELALSPSQPKAGLSSRARLAALRAGLGTLDRVAPELAGRAAFNLWVRLPANAGRRKDFRPYPGSVSQITTVRGTRIAVETWSPEPADGDAPVVYLVHGWGGWRGQLGGFVAPLVESGRRVVAFDAPSHGESGPGMLGARRGTLLEAIEAFAAVGAVFGHANGVVAHSMGCTVAGMTLAESGVAAARLALVAPNHDFTTMTHELATMLKLSERTRASMQGRVESLARRPMSDFDLVPLGVRGGLPPTLVVHDRLDKEVPHRVGVAVAESWPEAELLSTSGLGHQRILTDAMVVRAVVDHLE